MCAARDENQHRALTKLCNILSRTRTKRARTRLNYTMRRARVGASRSLLILTRYGMPNMTCRIFVLPGRSAGVSFRAPTEPSQKHFFCIFFAKNLHISKNSCTFAADFGKKTPTHIFVNI